MPKKTQPDPVVPPVASPAPPSPTPAAPPATPPPAGGPPAPPPSAPAASSQTSAGPAPIKANAAGLVAVTFTKHLDAYNPGETAGFDQATAERLIAKGYARAAVPK